MTRTSIRLLALVLAVMIPLTGAAAGQEPDPQAGALARLAPFGVQQDPSKQLPTDEQVAGEAPLPGVNPFLATPPAGQPADLAFYRELLRQRAEAAPPPAATAQADARAFDIEPFPTVQEGEPDTLFGRNDTLATAQLIGEAGTGEGEVPELEIEGTLAEVPVAETTTASTEDDGAIPLANPTGLGVDAEADRSRAAAQIGDGPHGTIEGDGTGDFDFYALPAVAAGQSIAVDVDAQALGSTLDPLVLLYDAEGTILAANDDAFEPGAPLDSFLAFTVQEPGDHFVAVVGFPSVPEDPFDSASGLGAGSEGPYEVAIDLDVPEDIDVYGVELAAGDVVSASTEGAATRVSLFDPEGKEVIGSDQDASVIYPEGTRLLGGGNAVLDHVADLDGRHFLAVYRGTGDYETRVRLQRPPAETGDGGTQVLFLDFDGEELNTAVFGGPGVRTLSPLSAFLGGWGLGADDEDAVIDAIVASVEESLSRDLEERGLEDDFDIEIRNSRDHPDTFGEEDVSRIVIGGTIEESGISTIGIAQTIDPGNFDREETALVLLDLLSADAGNANSLNQFVGPETDVVALVGTGVGNVTAHEAGHFFGNFHTDRTNDLPNIQDEGGDLANLVGPGPDGVFGTEDDIDVDFGEDRFSLFEGLSGVEDTLTRISFALTGPAEEAGLGVGDLAVEVTGRRARVSWAAPAAGAEAYVVRALRGDEVVATRRVPASATRAQFRLLPAGDYAFSVTVVADGAEGPATFSPPVAIGR